MTYLDIQGPSQKDLAKAISQFSAAVGAEHVLTSAKELEAFHDPFSFDAGKAHHPAAAVRPETVEQVQALVRIANENKIPLWVVSTGKNLGYGGAAPRVSGSVVIELGRMNKVLEVNEEQSFALVEPGVRFFDLYTHIRERNLKVWMSVPGLGWGSVIGNSLERGLGYTSYGDHSAQQCGMEVVLPDGDLVRTGMGAIENASTWQLYKPGFGPAIDGLFQQSNLGIVTKMGVWMMPQPEKFISVEAVVAEEKMLGPLIDALRPLKFDGTIESTLTIRSPMHLASKKATRKELWDGEGSIPDHAIEAAMKKFGIGWWNLNFALYGHESVVNAKLAIVRAVLDKIPGTKVTVRIQDGQDVNEDTVHPTDLHRAGIPNLGPYSAVNWCGENGGSLSFAPVSPMTGKDAVAQLELVRRYAREYGFDYYGSFNASSRCLIHIFQIFFDRDSERDQKALKEMFPKMVAEAAALGYSEYRAHLTYMDDVSDVFSFNNNALNRLTEKLKDTLDVNGILSPGKQGVWPAAMRDTIANRAGRK